jgi:aerobic-type carbon monoxide dehydrogenase small subunit (CoxS/CutS family)
MLTDDRLAPVFELAESRKVPILIHGGRGLPPIADDLARLVERYPEAQLIVAHAGIADLAGLAGHLGGKAGVFFDTSVWSPLDLLDLHRLVAPEQVVYASDYPYGSQPSSLLISVRTARLSGYSDEQLRDLLAGNARRMLAGEAPREPTTPIGGDTYAQPLTFARIHQYLSMGPPGRAGADSRAPSRRARPLAHDAGRGGRGGADADRARDVPPDPPRRHPGGDGRRMTFRLRVNGGVHELEAPFGRSLASVLRDDLGLTGTKVACGEGHCGACTVQLDGVPVLSCVTLVHTVGEREVTTIEGLRDHPLVDSFVRHDALQCGFCTPGQIVSAAALVASNPDPSSEEIRHGMAGNLCRCGAYPRIEEAIREWRG